MFPKQKKTDTGSEPEPKDDEPETKAIDPNAVIKIQAAQRAKTAKREVEALRQKKQTKTHEERESATKIQAIYRGKQERQDAAQKKKDMTAATLKIQTLARGKQARAQVVILRQDSMPAPVVKRPSVPRMPGRMGAPAPAGTNGPMSMLSAKELKVAFDMLDQDYYGVLDRRGSRDWLRCCGFALSDEILDGMLTEGAQGGRGVTVTWAVEEKMSFNLNELTDILEKNEHHENCSVDALQDALSILASGNPSVTHEVLLELIVQQGYGADDLHEVLELVGLADDDMFECNNLAFRVLDRIRMPPSITEIAHFKPAAAAPVFTPAVAPAVGNANPAAKKMQSAKSNTNPNAKSVPKT